MSDIRGSSVAGHPRPQISAVISLSYTSGVSAPPLFDPFPRHPNCICSFLYCIWPLAPLRPFISLSLLDLRIYIQERAPFPSKQTYLTTGYKFTLALHCTAITLISAASGIRFLVIYPQPYLDTLRPRLSFLEGARKQTHSLATRNAL